MPDVEAKIFVQVGNKLVEISDRLTSEVRMDLENAALRKMKGKEKDERRKHSQ